MSAEQDLAALDREALVAKWIEIIGEAPPARLRGGTMIRILTCELQWKASGQPRQLVRRQLQGALKAARSAHPQARDGTRLVREWNGREHVVDVTEEGYLWNGRVWRSLSAIAREITGTKWSGPRFFGVAA